jgi:hypothetical protein
MKTIRQTAYMLAFLAMVSCGGNNSSEVSVGADEETAEMDSMEQEKKERYEVIREKVQTNKDKQTAPKWDDKDEEFSFNKPLDEKK